MNIYYLVRNDKSNKNDTGFFNKFYGQIKTFLKNGDVFFVYRESRKFFAESQFDPSGKAAAKIQLSGASRLNHLLYYSRISRLLKNNPPDVIYMRYKISEPTLINFLRSVKQRYPRCLIFIEFPTFPYDQNWKEESLIKKVSLPVDRVFRRLLHKYADYAVSYTKSGNIFKMNTISIMNGISIEDVSLRQPAPKKSNSISLIGVAGISYWHGYDRIITGLGEYYKHGKGRKKVIFNVVGEGKELPNLKTLTSNLGLDKYVVFHGHQTGSDLDHLFNGSDIAISSIGIHRLNIDSFTALKSREYICRGIPYIMSGQDNSLPAGFKYVHHIPGDDSPVDIEALIQFHDKIIKEKNYINEMRKYAMKNLSWDMQLKDITGKFSTGKKRS